MPVQHILPQIKNPAVKAFAKIAGEEVRNAGEETAFHRHRVEETGLRQRKRHWRLRPVAHEQKRERRDGG